MFDRERAKEKHNNNRHNGGTWLSANTTLNLITNKGLEMVCYAAIFSRVKRSP